MKLHNGFISNSSSSSFIVALSKPASEYDLGEFISEFNVSSSKIEYAERLLDDLQSQDKEFDLENVYIYLNIDTSMLEVEVERKLESKYIDLIKKAVKKEIEKNKKKHKYSVEYSDNDSDFYAHMEHYFMPNFKGTIESINHH